MGWWSLLLLVVAILWLAQIVGTYYQVRHYRKVLSRITQEGGEGYVGTGNAKARFGKGRDPDPGSGRRWAGHKGLKDAGGDGVRQVQGGSGALSFAYRRASRREVG